VLAPATGRCSLGNAAPSRFSLLPQSIEAGKCVKLRTAQGMPGVGGGHNSGSHHLSNCCHRCRADASHLHLLSYCFARNRISGVCGCSVTEQGVAMGSIAGCSRLNRTAPSFAEDLSARDRGFLHHSDRVRSWISSGDADL
jgi:hypothetical protein